MSEPNAATRKEQPATTSPADDCRAARPESDPNDGTGVSEQPKGSGSLDILLEKPSDDSRRS